MNKLINIIYKLICLFLFILFGYITYSSIFKIYRPNDNDIIKLSPIILIVGSVILLLIILMFYKKIKKKNEKYYNLIALIMCIISFIIMSYFGIKYQTIFAFDLNHLEDTVEVLLNNHTMSIGYSWYLSVYPHQMPIVVLIYFVKKMGVLFGINPKIFMILYNSFMINISGYFLYKTIKDLKGKEAALIGLLIMMITPDFYLFVSYYYSDILCIPYTIIGFYLLIHADKITNKRKYLYRILGGLLFLIAYKLRVVCLILLISYIICNTFKEPLKNNFKRFTPIILSFIISLFIYTNLVVPSFNLKIDDTYTFPFTSWIMMGANKKTDGVYSHKDYLSTYSSKNKNADSIKEYKKRLKKIDFKFIKNKIRAVWSNGNHDINRQYQSMNRINYLHKFLDGEFSVFLRYFQQMILIVTYILFLIAIFKEINNNFNSSNISVLLIGVLGAFIFYMFWEAKVRYSFSFIPWIIIASSSSIKNIDGLLITKKKNIINKIIGVILISCLVYASYDAYIKYSYKKENHDIIKYIQRDDNKYISLYNNEIKQEFIIDTSFNVLELSFSKKGIVDKLKYNLSVYDDNDNLIYDYTFNANVVLKKKIAQFKLPNQTINENKKYYFILKSINDNKENHLLIGASIIDNCDSETDLTLENNGYDINVLGNTYINGKLACPELRMVLYENKNINIIDKKIFIIIALIINLFVIYTIYYLFFKIEK